MKIYLLPIISLFLIIHSSSAQNKVYEYDYDDSGNRISRTVVYLRTTQSGGSSADASIKQQTVQKNPDGVKGELTSTSISLFPNPTSSMVQVRFEKSGIQTEEARILNANGQVLYREQNLSGNFLLPFNDLAAGTYFIWLKINGKVERYQVVRQ